MQAFIKLRGAYFHEDGFCLDGFEIAPDGLRKDSCAYFSTLDACGKTVKLQKVPGTEGDADPAHNFPLTPYVFPEKAQKWLMLMCACLPGALAGKRNEKKMIADAWQVMVVSCCGLELQGAKTQMALLSNLYGRGRVLDELNKHGTIAELAKCDGVAMVNEALNL